MKANHNPTVPLGACLAVVASTTKIQKWKQITTSVYIVSSGTVLLPVRQRYKNESKSQPSLGYTPGQIGCCQYDKDTKMKANHNGWRRGCWWPRVVASTTKIQKWKQITTEEYIWITNAALLPVRQRYKNESKSQLERDGPDGSGGCCQYDKDTKMKANHNCMASGAPSTRVVASTTKIQKWKQITTGWAGRHRAGWLLPVRQRYKNESKSQPPIARGASCESCCQYDKDTKMKANHNMIAISPFTVKVVASTTKIQKWKQITTAAQRLLHRDGLLPVRQRYKNESKSQLQGWAINLFMRCCQYDKDTKMKANHNSRWFPLSSFHVVASTTKIQKWKQITTVMPLLTVDM